MIKHMNLANLVKKTQIYCKLMFTILQDNCLSCINSRVKNLGVIFGSKKGEGKGGAGLITKSATNITPFSLLLISYLLKCFDCLVWVNLSYKRESSLVCLMFKQIFFFFSSSFLAPFGNKHSIIWKKRPVSN